MSENTKRKAIPRATRQAVLIEAGYKCANPNCRHVITLELHHIQWVRDDGGNDESNLLALCPNCHSLHTQGHISNEAIKTWKGLLTSLNNQNRACIDFLLVLYREQERVAAAAVDDSQPTPPPFRFTGDSLPTISPLINSGLIETTTRFLGAGFFGPGGGPSFNLALTDAGNTLVEAWLSGKPESLALGFSKNLQGGAEGDAE